MILCALERISKKKRLLYLSVDRTHVMESSVIFLILQKIEFSVAYAHKKSHASHSGDKGRTAV